jgi:hypothetical protein
VLQELIGKENETGNVNIWFCRLEASRLTKTRYLTIILEIKKGGTVLAGCKHRPKAVFILAHRQISTQIRKRTTGGNRFFKMVSFAYL